MSFRTVFLEEIAVLMYAMNKYEYIHDELMRLKGKYYEMFTVQSRGEQCD